MYRQVYHQNLGTFPTHYTYAVIIIIINIIIIIIIIISALAGKYSPILGCSNQQD